MAPNYRYIADLAGQLPDIPTDSIVSRTLHSDDQVKVVLFGFAPGQELSEHTAASPAILHFVRGEALLSLGGEARQAGPGSWVHMPARLPHSVHAATEVIMLLLLLKAGGSHGPPGQAHGASGEPAD